MPTKVIMPQLGESVVEGTVSKWLKQVGDKIEAYEPLLEVSTDKVDTEVPSPASGVILQIYVPEGQTVERGVLLAMIGEAGEAGETRPEPPSTIGESVLDTAKQDIVQAARASERHPDNQEAAHRFSPVVARMAADYNLDLTRIKGSGLGGRVTKKDVEAYLQAQPQTNTGSSVPSLPPWEQPISGDLFKPTDEVFARANAEKQAPDKPAPEVQPEKKVPEKQPEKQTPDREYPEKQVPDKKGPEKPISEALPGEVVPLSNMRKLIADHMVRSNLTAPHVTTVFEVDMSRVMAHWNANMEPHEKQGVKLTLTAYFVAAIVKAAQAQPMLNSRLTDDGLYIYNVINVGMAVAVPDGLIVPVIKNAQDLSLSGIARQVSDLASRARAKALRPDDTTGGTITLSNHGVSGSLLATPIINQPQSAIIGTGAVQKRVIVLDDSDAIAVRPMMYVTLTFDHRVADGAVGDGFLAAFKRTLESWT